VFRGAYISLAALFCLIVLSLFDLEDFFLVNVLNMFFALGFGFFVPCLFSSISKKHPMHEQGKIYGLIDSTDALGLMIAVLIILISGTGLFYQLLIGSTFLSLLALGCFRLTVQHLRKND
jgi:sugar phosphate permease